jgi:hypothetical protein
MGAYGTPYRGFLGRVAERRHPGLADWLDIRGGGRPERTCQDRRGYPGLLGPWKENCVVGLRGRFPSLVDCVRPGTFLGISLF